jgi:hypothetical protein
MNKDEILHRLHFSHARFINQITVLPDSVYVRSINSKLTPGQQLEHIIKSVSPVNLAFGLPGFLLRILFGKANRPSRTYEELVEKYHAKLATGYKAPTAFVPKPISVHYRERLPKKLRALVYSVMYRGDSFSEKQLDTLLLPHPLLGKLTLREMLYFTIYHAEHHEKQVLQNLPSQHPPLS